MSADKGVRADKGANADKGVRGFELFAHLQFAHELPRGEAAALLAPYRLHLTLYGEDRVRGAALRGPLTPDFAPRLHAQLASGVLRYAEAGLRGYLRKGDSTEWMPWRRNALRPLAAALTLPFEEGVRYLLEDPPASGHSSSTA